MQLEGNTSTIKLHQKKGMGSVGGAIAAQAHRKCQETKGKCITASSMTLGVESK
jgi:hypothetical protein